MEEYKNIMLIYEQMYKNLNKTLSKRYMNKICSRCTKLLLQNQLNSLEIWNTRKWSDIQVIHFRTILNAIH